MMHFNLKKGIIVVAIFALLAIVSVFLYNRIQTQDTAYISAKKLLPYAPAAQVRVTICNQILDSFFQKICQKEFDNVGKNDSERIDRLLEALGEIKNDSHSSDYKKFLFGQLIFATLPTGQSSVALNSTFLPAFSNVSDFFGLAAYAKEVGMTREQYEESLTNDLTSIMKNCPKAGDENYIITAMCSEHTWVDGERQPIYSKQYTSAGGPHWCDDAGEAGATKNYHTQSVINTKMRSENTFSSPVGVSKQIACMFSCGSYSSASSQSETSDSKCEPEENFTDFTESGYAGNDFLKKILDKVKTDLAKPESNESGGESVPNSTCTGFISYEDAECANKCSVIYEEFKSAEWLTDEWAKKGEKFNECKKSCIRTECAGYGESDPVLPSEHPTFNSSNNGSGQVPPVESR